MVDWDALWINGNLATMVPGETPYGAIIGGALAVKDGRIAWVGDGADLPANAKKSSARVVDAAGRWITPGLIDCHTHMVFAGSRAGEFEMLLEGATYADIARAGGGIVSTVKATREASEDDLVESAATRLRDFCAEGVTTVEIKSGYGLDADCESKMLRAARRLGALCPAQVVTSFLGAHAVPPEYQGRADAFIDLVCEDVLPRVAEERLADAVDAFCETIAFTPAQTTRIFETAGAFELPVKLHADQLSDSGGASLAARFGALSADHLECTSEDGVAAMAQSGTVAVLLPGAFYALGETRLPPIDAMRRHAVAIAVASDCNPGSSPTRSLLLMLNMACKLFRLTPEEALAGVTRNGARALGLGEDRGMLAPGMRADLALWDIDHPAELAYWMGSNPCAGVVRAGEAVARDADR